MANEADFRAAATALRAAESTVGWTAFQLRQMWGDGLGMWGGAITPVVHDGVGNSIANGELLRTELADRARDCDTAAEVAAAFRAAMVEYRRDLGTWEERRLIDPEDDQGARPRRPDNGYYGTWPSWVSE